MPGNSVQEEPILTAPLQPGEVMLLSSDSESPYMAKISSVLPESIATEADGVAALGWLALNQHLSLVVYDLQARASHKAIQGAACFAILECDLCFACLVSLGTELGLA